MKWTLGCLAVCIVLAFLFVAGLVGFGFWARNQLNTATGGGPEVEAARKSANAVGFIRPANRVIAEARLVGFIKVRADVFSVYEKYRGEIQSRTARLKDGSAPGISDIASDLATGFTLIGELQRAEALALAKQGMPEDEYAFITEEVYRSMWNGLGADNAARDRTRASAATRAAVEDLKHLDPVGMPREAQDALAQAAKGAAAGADEVAKSLERMQTPAENLALFKKYEADLKKYAMPGLTALFSQDGRTADPKK